MLEAPYILPPRGASIFLPAQLQTALGANTTGATQRVRWPFRTLVIGLRMSVSTGNPFDLARLSLEMQDGEEHRITTDGQGFQLFISGQAMIGGITRQGGLGVGGLRWGRPFKFQRLVQAGEIWSITLKNTGAVPFTPEVGFDLAVPNG